MILTILLSLVMMAGLFLMLLSGVGFIQDKKFFSSAPQEVQAVVQPREERFPGAHAIGWCMAVISILMMGGAVVYGAWDGIRNGFSFGQFFARFLIMLWGLKAYDILFFDAFLLCRSNFFPHFYPETKPVLGPHLFGYNKKTHLVHIVAMLIGSAVLGWVCTLLQ